MKLGLVMIMVFSALSLTALGSESGIAVSMTEMGYKNITLEANTGTCALIKGACVTTYDVSGDINNVTGNFIIPANISAREAVNIVQKAQTSAMQIIAAYPPGTSGLAFEMLAAPNQNGNFETRVTLGGIRFYSQKNTTYAPSNCMGVTASKVRESLMPLFAAIDKLNSEKIRINVIGEQHDPNGYPFMHNIINRENIDRVLLPSNYLLMPDWSTEIHLELIIGNGIGSKDVETVENTISSQTTFSFKNPDPIHPLA